MLLPASPSLAAEQHDRLMALSLQFVPKSTAVQTGRTAGFAVAPNRFLSRENQWPVLQNTEEVLIFFYKQNPAVKVNGIWIVVNDQKAYTPQEKALLEDIVGECDDRGIPLYVCQFAELPDGWKRRLPDPAVQAAKAAKAAKEKGQGH